MHIAAEQDTDGALSDRGGFNVRSVQRSIAALEKENLITLESGKITVSQEQFVKMRKYLEEQEGDKNHEEI